MNNTNVEEEKKRVLWPSIGIFQVKKNEPNNLFYKTEYDNEYSCITLYRPRRRMKAVDITSFTVNPAYPVTIQIPKKKYDDLIHMCKSGAVPKIYHNFFESLSHKSQIDNENSDGDN